MNKPLTVMRQEFTEALVNLVNESGLPAFIVRNELANVYEKLAEIEQAQLQHDMKAWEEQKGESDG